MVSKREMCNVNQTKFLNLASQLLQCVSICYLSIFFKHFVILGWLSPPDPPCIRDLQFQTMRRRTIQTNKSHPMGRFKVQGKVKVNAKRKVQFYG